MLSFGLASCMEDGKTPYIGENGNWWIGDVDQGVPATGPKGDEGTKGDKGENGISVLKIEKTKAEGNVDTYTITYSNETSTTFTVTNGEDADDLTVRNVSIKSQSNNVDTYEIEFSDGYKSTFTVTNGEDGKNLSVVSIDKEKTEGKYDTYKISFSDESSQTFVVTNGVDGLTPYIGENGNWWIGEEDTGVLADYEKANNIPLTIYSSGLKYVTMTYDKTSGYVVTGWDEALFNAYIKEKYSQDEIAELDKVADTDKQLVIPNYIGNVPVIGVAAKSALNFGKVTLSNNIIYLAEEAFSGYENLKEIDFNNCNITTIPKKCFTGTSLSKIEFPKTVTKICDSAFELTPITYVDLTNIKYVGNNAFDDTYMNYVYIPKTVEYVGDNSFGCTFVYVENETKPSTWGGISRDAFGIFYNVKNNDEYFYSIENNEATLYQYLGTQSKLVIPATIDDKPITTIGSGFNSPVFDEDLLDDKSREDRYNFLTNLGCIRELIIGNNVKKIDKFSLMNCNMLIYVGKNVQYIGMTDGDGLIGLLYDRGGLYSLIVLEDSTKTKFYYSDSNIKTYDELIASDDDLEVLFRPNISYEDILYDEENKIYYAKDGSSYKVISCKNYYGNSVVIKDTINNLPVKTIDKYAFVGINIGKVLIGSNVNKIKTGAFFSVTTRLFIPKNVEIINSKGIDLDGSYSTIYVEASAKPDDWDSVWNADSYTNVVYSASKNEFINTFFTEEFMYKIKTDNTIELVKYLGSSNTIKIPRTIDGKVVTSIKEDFVDAKSSATYIYIPKTVEVIESMAFEVTSNVSLYIYLEDITVPSTYSTNWYYNTYYSSNTKYIYVQTSYKLDY